MTYKSLKNIFIIVLYLFICSFSYWTSATACEDNIKNNPSLTLEEKTNLLKTLQEKPMDETSESLCAYRNSIEELSYNMTMRLCFSYKMLKEQEVSEDHYNYVKELKDNDPTITAFTGNLAIPNTTSSVVALYAKSAWNQIIWEGFIVAGTVMFGKKADYLAVQDEDFFSEASWFQSLYTQYLVLSHGFKQASSECLSTPEERKSFKSTITNIDYALSVVSQVGFIFVPIAGLGYLAKAIFKFVPFSSSIKVGWNHLKKKTAQLSKEDKTFLIPLTTVTTSMFSISVLEKNKKREKKQQQISSMFEILSLQAKTQALYTSLKEMVTTHTLTMTEKRKDFFLSQLEQLEQKDQLNPIEEQYFSTLSVLKFALDGTSTTNEDINTLTEFMKQESWINIRVKEKSLLALFLYLRKINKEVDNQMQINETDSCLFCDDINRQIIDKINTTFSEIDFEFMQSDLEKLHQLDEENILEQDKKTYFDLLKLFLPIVEEAFITQDIRIQDIH